jgi:hypothetical protein
MQESDLRALAHILAEAKDSPRRADHPRREASLWKKLK